MTAIDWIKVAAMSVSIAFTPDVVDVTSKCLHFDTIPVAHKHIIHTIFAVLKCPFESYDCLRDLSVGQLQGDLPQSFHINSAPEILHTVPYTDSCATPSHRQLRNTVTSTVACMAGFHMVAMP